MCAHVCNACEKISKDAKMVLQESCGFVNDRHGNFDDRDRHGNFDDRDRHGNFDDRDRHGNLTTVTVMIF